MHSLWEIMGRLVSDAAFRNSLLSNISLRTPNPLFPPKNAAVDIPISKYATLTSSMAMTVKTQPVAPFIQGEMLRALGEPSLDANLIATSNRVSALGGSAGAQSLTYFMLLGAMTFDDTFRAQVKALPNAGAVVSLGFPVIPTPEFNTLQAIANDAQFDQAATSMINNNWQPACFCRATLYAGVPQKHPIGSKL